MEQSYYEKMRSGYKKIISSIYKNFKKDMFLRLTLLQDRPVIVSKKEGDVDIGTGSIYSIYEREDLITLHIKVRSKDLEENCGYFDTIKLYDATEELIYEKQIKPVFINYEANFDLTVDLYF